MLVSIRGASCSRGTSFHLSPWFIAGMQPSQQHRDPRPVHQSFRPQSVHQVFASHAPRPCSTQSEAIWTCTVCTKSARGFPLSPAQCKALGWAGGTLCKGILTVPGGVATDSSLGLHGIMPVWRIAPRRSVAVCCPNVGHLLKPLFYSRPVWLNATAASPLRQSWLCLRVQMHCMRTHGQSFDPGSIWCKEPA
jgi:hypothetical protein